MNMGDQRWTGFGQERGNISLSFSFLQFYLWKTFSNAIDNCPYIENTVIRSDSVLFHVCFVCAWRKTEIKTSENCKSVGKVVLWNLEGKPSILTFQCGI